MLKTTMRRANVRFTYNDYLLLPEDKRYEILDGELRVVPAPNIQHQRISQKLEIALVQHVEKRGMGLILHAPCDVVLSSESVVQPDILFVGRDKLGIVGEENIRGAPDLLIEILSAATRSKDLEVKRKIYASYGIQEYWVVDPEAATVEVLVWSELGYMSATTYGRSGHLSSPLLPELNLPLCEVFPVRE